MTQWQPTLKSFTPVSGTPGQPGAVAELVYEENGREVTLTERVTERREPDFMAGSYESSYGTANIVNLFEALPDGTTRWAAYWRHSFKGFFRLLAPFMRKAMAKRVEDDLNRFKLFVESATGGQQ